MDPNYSGDANHLTVDTNSVLRLTMIHDWEVEARFKCGSSEMLPALGVALLSLGALGLIRRRGMR